MAIIRRSDADVNTPSERTEGTVAVEEAPATQHAPAARDADQAPASLPTPPPAAAAGAKSMSESLPSALEPELRRIIDAAVARVAAIELEAIRDARELTQRSENEAREALKFALDRAFNLIATLELMAATVSGMADALKIELDDAIAALRNVPQPQSELAKELAPETPAAPEAPPAPEPAAAQAEPEPQAAPEPKEPEAAAPEPKEPEAAQPEPASEPEPQPVAAEPEPAPEPRAEAPAIEEPAAEPGRNGFSPAERQAQSLAAVAAREREAQGAAETTAAEAEPDPEPERTVVMVGPSDGDGRPAVPVRRKGLMRRLFTK